MSKLLSAFVSRDPDHFGLDVVGRLNFHGGYVAASTDGAVCVLDFSAPLPDAYHTNNIQIVIDQYLNMPTVKVGKIKSSDLAKQIKPLPVEPCACPQTVCMHNHTAKKKPARPDKALRIGPALVDCAILRKLLSSAPSGLIDVQATNDKNPVFMYVPGKWLAIVMPLRPTATAEGLTLEFALAL